jgi:LmbE family N-acetylglucosaminyl deacetylase
MIRRMRVTREKAAGVVRWLGAGGKRDRLPDEVFVVSPHLDDAVFSLGAAVSRASRAGARVVILTALAGDPESETPAGEWDRQAGFRTAGEAAHARRLEDERACGLLGADPAWLPFFDLQYERGGSDDEIRAAIVGAVGSSRVLLPGFPLMNPDHRWLNKLLDGAFEREAVGLYAEQPYAALWSSSPPATWRRLGAGLRDQWHKLAACRAYASQLPRLGPVVGPIFRYEMRAGGEAAAW